MVQPVNSNASMSYCKTIASTLEDFASISTYYARVSILVERPLMFYLSLCIKLSYI